MSLGLQRALCRSLLKGNAKHIRLFYQTAPGIPASEILAFPGSLARAPRRLALPCRPSEAPSDVTPPFHPAAARDRRLFAPIPFIGSPEGRASSRFHDGGCPQRRARDVQGVLTEAVQDHARASVALLGSLAIASDPSTFRRPPWGGASQTQTQAHAALAQ